MSSSVTGRRARLLVIAAPSGAGKTTLVRALLDRNPSLSFSISYTTRKKRETEQDGRDYFFVTEDRFAQLEGGPPGTADDAGVRLRFHPAAITSGTGTAPARPPHRQRGRHCAALTGCDWRHLPLGGVRLRHHQRRPEAIGAGTGSHHFQKRQPREIGRASCRERV